MERTAKEAGQDLGRYAEVLFHAEALRRGLGVYAPLQSFPHVDCMVETDHRIWRVQIKARSKKALNPTSVGYCFERHHGKPYDSDTFDVLAAWLSDDQRWAFVEAAQVCGRRHAYYLENRTRNDARTIRWSDWGIFNAPANSDALIHAELEVTA